MMDKKSSVSYTPPKPADSAEKVLLPRGSYWYSEKLDTVYVLTKMYQGEYAIWGTISLKDGTLWLCAQVKEAGRSGQELKAKTWEAQNAAVCGLVRIPQGSEIHIVVEEGD